MKQKYMSSETYICILLLFCGHYIYIAKYAYNVERIVFHSKYYNVYNEIVIIHNFILCRCAITDVMKELYMLLRYKVREHVDTVTFSLHIYCLGTRNQDDEQYYISLLNKYKVIES